MFRPRRAVVSLVMLGLTLPAGLARAGDAPEDQAFQRQLFGRVIGKEGTYACFTRTYDAGHLASHPRQNVRTMKLLVTGRSSDDAPTYTLTMDVTFRKSREHFGTGGFCGSLHGQTAAGTSRPTVHCGIDCDGGSIDVSLKDARSVVIGIPEGARISSARDEDEAVDHSKRFGSDDKVFRLDRARITDCLSLANDEDKPAMRRLR